MEHDPRYLAIAPVVVPAGVRAVLGVPVHIGGLRTFVPVIETTIAAAVLSERLNQRAFASAVIQPSSDEIRMPTPSEVNGAITSRSASRNAS